MIERLRRVYTLSRRAFGNYKKSIFFLTIFGLLNGLLAGIGINMLIPIFSFVAGDSSLYGGDVISGLVYKFFLFLHIDFTLKYVLIFACLLFVVRSIILLFTNYFISVITADYERVTRDFLFSKTIRADWPYLLKQKVGYLEMVIVNDIRYSTAFLKSLSGFIITLTSLIIYIVVAVNISLPITILTFLFGLFYLYITKPLLVRIKKIALKTSNMYKEASNFMSEHVRGMKTVKVFAVEHFVDEIAKKKFLLLRDFRVKTALLSGISGAITQPLSIFFIAGVFAVFYKSQNFNIGALLALVYLIQKIFAYFNQLQSDMQKAVGSAPYLQSALAYEDKAKEFSERVEGKKDFSSENDLCFDRVSFSYPGGEEVLCGINFCLKRGEVTGLVGVSGGGKTTIADLILRLFEPSEGRIVLGKIDIKDIHVKEWRNKIGYVSQDMFLLNDTIENNIRFYDEQVSMLDIESAARDANIYDMIINTPDGFQTKVGEGGNLLSGGQRQRIIIARALVRKPNILILDEATSALDTESEVQIQHTINHLKGKMAILVIAHRLSTIMNCDELVVLDRGTIVERGKPKNLQKNKDSYLYKVL
jgi:ABC-type multidrug transport system fused ATPase/permease subunit